MTSVRRARDQVQAGFPAGRGPDRRNRRRSHPAAARLPRPGRVRRGRRGTDLSARPPAPAAAGRGARLSLPAHHRRPRSTPSPSHREPEISAPPPAAAPRPPPTSDPSSLPNTSRDSPLRSPKAQDPFPPQAPREPGFPPPRHTAYRKPRSSPFHSPLQTKGHFPSTPGSTQVQDLSPQSPSHRKSEISLQALAHHKLGNPCPAPPASFGSLPIRSPLQAPYTPDPACHPPAPPPPPAGFQARSSAPDLGRGLGIITRGTLSQAQGGGRTPQRAAPPPSLTFRGAQASRRDWERQPATQGFLRTLELRTFPRFSANGR
ncbi:proline-rich protein HaeIII subfamily 1-like [Lynx rufus]|uniref:proline-rich protein HaeIII subfamily 1-like n=1 Tax=Lynx rufus TaxID=61384 RepID=UPI001F123FC9|nr:proline-rich protein HaeIII subfamily 1-like [Lynx rufus]